MLLSYEFCPPFGQKLLAFLSIVSKVRAKQAAHSNVYFDYGAKQGARRPIHSTDLFVAVFAFASVLYFVLKVYRAIRVCQVEILCLSSCVVSLTSLGKLAKVKFCLNTLSSCCKSAISVDIVSRSLRSLEFRLGKLTVKQLNTHR